MSRNERRIRKALEAKGYVVDMLEWTPITSAPIMCGPEGGWYVDIDLPDEDAEYEETPRHYTILGYNIQEVMDEIEKLPTLKVKTDANPTHR